jgi:hypothetical protein
MPNKAYSSPPSRNDGHKHNRWCNTRNPDQREGYGFFASICFHLSNSFIAGPSELKLQISITTDKTVLELKQAIAAKSDVEAERQRLIYSGKLDYLLTVWYV